MSYQLPPLLEPTASDARQAPSETGKALGSHWRDGLPLLTGTMVTLRELHVNDAPALFAALSHEMVTRFLTPPPPTVERFEAFIGLAQGQRQAGKYVCFAVVPHGSETPIGLFQVRALDPSFETAEWGFAFAPEFWGTGVFVDGARLLVNFVFDVVGARRLEARAAMRNGRGNGALKKIGAVMEGVLRRAVSCNGEYLDQALWTILRDEWADALTVSRQRVMFH